MSGETANFLAGGQVPIVTPQPNGIVAVTTDAAHATVGLPVGRVQLQRPPVGGQGVVGVIGGLPRVQGDALRNRSQGSEVMG